MTRFTIQSHLLRIETEDLPGGARRISRTVHRLHQSAGNRRWGWGVPRDNTGFPDTDAVKRLRECDQKISGLRGRPDLGVAGLKAIGEDGS